MTTDLWPNFDVSAAKPTPKTIIEQAGEGLEQKTNGLVRFYLQDRLLADNKMSLSYSFYAARLSYAFPFLKVEFPLPEGYPVELTADKLPTMLRASNEEELLDALEKIFKFPGTIETIQKLISLSA